jgi:hypothetical protein
MVQDAPLVSVIIVNHNGIDFVDTCLRSVLSSQYKNFEIIFVDNGSTDASLEYVKKTFGNKTKLKFVENSTSVGPAVGRNRGARVSSGKYLVFLDNDTQVDQNCIAELTQVLEKDNSIGAAQAKLLRMNSNLYDCAGDYLGPLGFLIERSRGAKDTGQFDFIADILSAKSAASIIRRDLFERIRGFDEDYYMYLEETDLSWRVWLAGYRVVFIPGAVVYHAFNTPKKDFKKYYPSYIVRYYGCRNYITTLIKNLQFKSLIAILPPHIFSWLVMAVLFSLKGNIEGSFYILKGIFWNILNMNILISKHKANNTMIRKIRDEELLDKLKSKESPEDTFKKILTYLKTKL